MELSRRSYSINNSSLSDRTGSPPAQSLSDPFSSAVSVNHLRLEAFTELLEESILTGCNTLLTPPEREALRKHYIEFPRRYDAESSDLISALSKIRKWEPSAEYSSEDICFALSFIRYNRYIDTIYDWVEAGGPMPQPFHFSRMDKSESQAFSVLCNELGMGTVELLAGTIEPRCLNGAGKELAVTTEKKTHHRFLISIGDMGMLSRNKNHPDFLSLKPTPPEALLRLVYLATPIDLTIALRTRKLHVQNGIKRIHLLPRRLVYDASTYCPIPEKYENVRLEISIELEDLIEGRRRVFVRDGDTANKIFAFTFTNEAGNLQVTRELLDTSKNTQTRSEAWYKLFLKFTSDPECPSYDFPGIPVYTTGRKENITQKRAQFGSKHISLPPSYPHATVDLACVRMPDGSAALGIWEPGVSRKDAKPIILVKRVETGWNRIKSNLLAF